MRLLLKYCSAGNVVLLLRLQNCNTWAWCGDISGCDGKLQTFLQCWLQAGDARNPSPKGGYGNSKGWISGVRGAFIPS